MKQQLFEEIKEHLAARLHISTHHKIFTELKDLLKSKKKLTPKVSKPSAPGYTGTRTRFKVQT